MSQKLILSVLFSMFVSVVAQAKAIEACSQDAYTSERISEETSATQRLDVLNEKGDLIGVVVYSPESEEKMLHALYLCGSNSGYYYINADLVDWIKAASGKTPVKIGLIYNDEYDVSATGHLVNGLLKLQIRVAFSGEPEDADYPEFAGTLFVKLP